MIGTPYFLHESSFIDEDVQIGEGTKIWHFSHIQRGARIGARCSLGQNVNVSNNVRVGDVVDSDLKVLVEAGMLRATSDFEFVRDVDFIAICVPTPLDRHQQPGHQLCARQCR